LYYTDVRKFQSKYLPFILLGLGSVIMNKDAQHLKVRSATRNVVFDGGTVLGQSIAAQVVDASQPKTTQPLLSAREVFHQLTDREFEVLEWLAIKRRNREIALALGITEKTVRNHISNIVWKLEAKDRNAVMLSACLAGLGLMTPCQNVVRNQSVPNTPLETGVTDFVRTNYSQIPIGREHEWDALEMAWNAGLFMYITGPAGVGKTRLMHAFAASRGGMFIEFNGRPGDAAVPYASFARSIRKLLARFPEVKHEPWIIKELQRIVPALGSITISEQNNSIEATIRLCDAIAAFHVNLAPRMTGMLVDDIEYFDQASAEASIYTISSWERFSGNVGEAQHFIACFQAGRLKPEIEQGIRQQASAGIVALIELERPVREQTSNTI
jgi:DNA-binding CsgD family transcriptional regulator